MTHKKHIFRLFKWQNKVDWKRLSQNAEKGEETDKDDDK